MSRTRRVAAAAATGVAAVLVGALSGPAIAGAQESQHIDVRLAYTCVLPAGPQPVELRVLATFPPSAGTGEPITASEASFELTVPPPALADLPGLATATSIIRLDTAVAQGDGGAAATWTSVQDVPAPPAEEGTWVLGGAAEVPPVTVDAAGDVSFTAGALVAAVTGYQADGTVTEPPSVELACALDEGQNALLATVPVSDPGDGAAPPSRTALPNPGGGGISVGGPAASPPVGTAGVVPPECHPITPPPNQVSVTYFCANMGGYSNVAKLNASVMQPPGIVNIAAGRIVVRCNGDPKLICQKATVQPDLGGQPDLPPAPGSFLAFGFVPTTATMQLTQIGLADVDITFGTTPPPIGRAIVTVKLSARIFDAEVNGVPLDVGPNCRTAVPIDAVLTAREGTYSITNGGVLTGTITIPPFSGCGATEDLDPIFTGMVSGPGNFVKMTQGRICTINSGFQCPPEVPILQR